jgi:hypothetical protein
MINDSGIAPGILGVVRKVHGRCPACAQETLSLGSDNRLRCLSDGCPRPDAAHLILGDGETEHVVIFGESGWTLYHPLRERLDDGLATCRLHRYLADLFGRMPAADIAAYADTRQRVTPTPDGGWAWYPLPH